jgi:uncharacterized protein YcnI
MTRWRWRWSVAALVVAIVGVAGQPAWAHVTAETTAHDGADGTSTLRFSFEHGCDGEATTALRVALPSGAVVVTTQEPEGWSADVLPSEIEWSGGAVADGEAGEFTAGIRHRAAEGDTVLFPVVQKCGSAELAWIDVDPAASNPAPGIRWAVVGPAGVVETSVTASDHSHGSSTAVIAAVIGGLVLVSGLVVYAVVRRRRSGGA